MAARCPSTALLPLPQDIAATYELAREEGPLAGANTAACTGAAPTPLPGATSMAEEEALLGVDNA